MWCRESRPLRAAFSCAGGKVLSVVRRMLTVGSVLSLPLCVVLTGLWIIAGRDQSYTARWGEPNRPQCIFMYSGSITYRMFPPLPVPFATAWQEPLVEVSLPLPLVIIVLGGLSVCWLIHAITRRKSDSREFCIKCGYDLRASEDRCPECGTAIPLKQEFASLSN